MLCGTWVCEKHIVIARHAATMDCEEDSSIELPDWEWNGRFRFYFTAPDKYMNAGRMTYDKYYVAHIKPSANFVSCALQSKEGGSRDCLPTRMDVHDKD